MAHVPIFECNFLVGTLSDVFYIDVVGTWSSVTEVKNKNIINNWFCRL